MSGCLCVWFFVMYVCVHVWFCLYMGILSVGVCVHACMVECLYRFCNVSLGVCMGLCMYEFHKVTSQFMKIYLHIKFPFLFGFSK